MNNPRSGQPKKNIVINKKQNIGALAYRPSHKEEKNELSDLSRKPCKNKEGFETLNRECICLNKRMRTH
ncbi:MAG: hypothetical protein LBR15_08340 [Methanobrevibacter sp.]|jgi:hypothetical protein|nr:hypothetical protein [Candidatus Methanovirga australis]